MINAVIDDNISKKISDKPFDNQIHRRMEAIDNDIWHHQI